MNFKKMNLFHIISIIVSLGCIALCFQGCGQNTAPAPQNQTLPTPLSNGTWKLNELTFHTQNESRTSHDETLFQLHSRVTANRDLSQTPLLTLTIHHDQAQVTLDLSTESTLCQITIDAKIAYGKTHCGCSTLTLNFDPNSTQTSASSASDCFQDPQLNRNLDELSNLDQIFSLVQSHLGNGRVYHYAKGGSSFKMDSKKNGNRSSFTFEQSKKTSGGRACCASHFADPILRQAPSSH